MPDPFSLFAFGGGSVLGAWYASGHLTRPEGERWLGAFFAGVSVLYAGTFAHLLGLGAVSSAGCVAATLLFTGLLTTYRR